MIEKVYLETSSYQKPPLKFESGTPMIVQAIALHEALDFIDGIGIDQISKMENNLTKQALRLLKKIEGIRILGPEERRGAIISFVHKTAHPLDLASLLDLKGIAVRSGHLCAQPALRHFDLDACLRISFGVYNTEEEVERALKIMEKIIQKIACY